MATVLVLVVGAAPAAATTGMVRWVRVTRCKNLVDGYHALVTDPCDFASTVAA